jgi:FixJ family two-component response regulator
MSTHRERLADAINSLARATENNTRVLEILIEGMKPSTEAALTGVSVRTVSRRRKARKMEKLLT